MEIRQLEYFVSASLLGNLTRVAERHFVSQPNITIAIKKLETELGVTLFDRKKNKLVLTEEGMFFLQKIEPILIALKNSVAEMKDYRNENGGIVTLGIPPMISLFLFSPLFKHFREIYPEMELSLVEEGTFGLHDKLSAGELDLAIVIINDCPKELVTVPGNTQSDSQMDYSQIPAWHRNLTLAVFILSIAGMVATDYIKFLPPMHIIACCAAIVLVFAGVLTQKETFNSFETLTVFMLAFMMPLGAALNSTGAGEMIANAVISVTGDSGVMIIMASLWILTWALTQVMSNTAACTLLCPVGWTIAQSIGADPRAVVIAVFIASSVAVCTPMAIPANSMIIGPGNVKFKDFLKPGLAISLVCFIVSMILLPIFYPFY